MQPYTNPYYFQNNPTYAQPQYGQINPYPDRLAQLQAQQQQLNQSQYGQQIPAQQMGLSGEIVDSIDVVKAKNVDMSGNVTYYPKADLSEIFTKQLMPDGTSKIVTYRAMQSDQNEQRERDVPQYATVQNINDMFAQFKNDLMQNILDNFTDIKQMLSQTEPQQKTQKGGNQK